MQLIKVPLSRTQFLILTMAEIEGITVPFDCGNWDELMRRMLNILVYSFVQALYDINKAYANQPWFECVRKMHELANFGNKNNTQITGHFLACMDLHVEFDEFLTFGIFLRSRRNQQPSPRSLTNN